MKGRASLSWSSAWPRPATLPWPKIPSAAGTSRRRCPSATEYCLEKKVTMAWATVSRTVSVGMVSASCCAAGRVRPWLPGPAVEHDRLELCHLLDRPARPFLADAAALETAIRHEVGPPQRGPVDVDAAGVDLA